MAATPDERMRVLIVGGGTAGWMTAAALAALLPRAAVRVELVESEAIGTVGVGEATVPHIRFFNARLEFDEADFMAQTRATFKLGIEFVNWGRRGDSYIHPFGAFGEDFDGVAFHQHWLRARQLGIGEGLQDYSLPVRAARANRFAHPAADPASLLATYSYAYQFDAGLYAAYLRRYAEARGVVRHEGRITNVDRRGDDGGVESVTLESGTRLAADLFVDCSGFRGLLIGETLGVDYEDWRHWLPCDRAFAVPCPSAGELTPYTRATAQAAGWTWRIPLQHRVGNGHVYSSAFTDDDTARDTLLGQLEAPPAFEPKQLRFTTGKRRRQWSHNVVAVGLSSGFLEPLESTSIHLIQLAIGYLVDLFPDRGFDPVNATEFNRVMALEYERIRDFLILHYHATERDDSPFWDYCRTMQVPDSLAHRLALFRERGIVPHYREGMFLDASWLAVCFGQRLEPRAPDPAATRLDATTLERRLDALVQGYSAATRTLPPHRDYLDRIGAAAAEAG